MPDSDEFGALRDINDNLGRIEYLTDLEERRADEIRPFVDGLGPGAGDPRG